MPRVKVDDVEPDAPQGASTSSVKSQGLAASKNKNEAKVLAAENPVHDHSNDSPVDAELEKKSSSSTLSAFVAHPPGIFFADKEPTEELLLLLRAHIITNVPWVLMAIILAIVPLIVLPTLSVLGFLTGVGFGIILTGTIFWYLVTFTFAFIKFLYWYFNVYIVTSERVIDVDWYSVIIRKVSSTQISKIQDASALQIGVFAGIFDYGNVIIQTAGTEENFEFTAVPHPQLVAKKIEELMQQEEREMEGGGGGENI